MFSKQNFTVWEKVSSCLQRKNQVISMNDLATPGIFWKGETSCFHKMSTELTVTIQKASVPEALQSGSPCGVDTYFPWMLLLDCHLYFSCVLLWTWDTSLPPSLLGTQLQVSDVFLHPGFFGVSADLSVSLGYENDTWLRAKCAGLKIVSNEFAVNLPAIGEAAGGWSVSIMWS